MIELEKLYECADRYLLNNPPNWDEFTTQFCEAFESEMALYQPGFEHSGADLLSAREMICTSSPQIIEEYLDKQLYQLDYFYAGEFNALEPLRRTDVMNDAQYLKHEISVEFLIPNNVFNFMSVFAILPGEAVLVLFVWRNKSQKNYSELEKQRIALFMRYLASLVNTSAGIPAHEPDSNVMDFGERYGLTDSEVGVLSALLQGHSLKNIAKESGRAYTTVRWHVQNILEKCQVKTQKNLLSEFYRLIKR